MSRPFILLQFYFFISLKIYSQNWVQVDTNIYNAPQALYFDSLTNSLYVGGQYYRVYNGDTIVGIGQYKNGQWFRMGNGVDWWKSVPWSSSAIPNPVNSIIRYKGILYITGAFSYSWGTTLNGIAKWDGVKWCNLGTGLKLSNGNWGVGNKFKIYNNELYLAGGFDSINGVIAHGLAKFDGTSWSAVNNLPIIDGTANNIYDVEIFNGEIYAGGIMDNGSTIKDIIKWNGTAWVNPGIGFYSNGYVRGITTYNNDLYVVGSYSYFDHPLNPGNCIIKYNGSVWQQLGTGMLFYPNNIAWINSYKIYKNKLYLGGAFQKCNETKIQSITIYDGAKFCSFDTTTYFNIGVDCIEFYHDSLYIGGYLKPGLESLARCVDYNYTDNCVASAIGIEEYLKDEIFVIYPNPASNTLYISDEKNDFEKSEIEIANTLGQTVLKLPYKNEIDVSGLAEGCYILKIITSDKQQFHSKFIKE